MASVIQGTPSGYARVRTGGGHCYAHAGAHRAAAAGGEAAQLDHCDDVVLHVPAAQVLLHAILELV
eukprot:4869406-Lingulodinium_polyedra.AAC.1